ncbi:MAG: amidohydrolase family protein [Gemmatimonadaceae bacterium]|nr:amidohydrolase family protein [Gemmatimonadaceae bacterium]
MTMAVDAQHAQKHAQQHAPQHASTAVPLGGSEPLIDPHAHFHTPWTNRGDWQRYNQSRLISGHRMGVRCHVASVLGSWGHTSPTYFASPSDQTHANQAMLALAAHHAPFVKAFVAVNPNFRDHALREIEYGMSQGAVGIKLAAGRRTTDFAVLDAMAEAAAAYGVPVLQHVWQHRRRDWPNQDASDGAELAALAARHPTVTFLLAHIGGGGDWAHTSPAVFDVPNIVMDLSGSGIDRGMMDDALRWIGARRLLWAADLTLCTGLTKLRGLQYTGVSADDIADIRWRNAVRIFPTGTFDAALGAPWTPAVPDALSHAWNGSLHHAPEDQVATNEVDRGGAT